MQRAVRHITILGVRSEQGADSPARATQETPYSPTGVQRSASCDLPAASTWRGAGAELRLDPLAQLRAGGVVTPAGIEGPVGDVAEDIFVDEGGESS